MEDIYLDLGADLQISEDSLLFIDDNNSISSTDDVMTGPPGPQGPKGDPGFSPIANVTQTETGATISITDETGTTTANITNGMNGSDGRDGVDGVAATIAVGDVETLLPTDSAVVTNSGTSSAAVFNFGIPQGEKGDQGIQGNPGVSPRAVVEQTATGATITIEDYQTVTTADITNGTDGTDGQDGFSPIATVTQNTGSATISITDAQGTTTATIYDGTDGTDGTDGFSPVATVTQNTGSATISITDSQGTTTATVYDGQNGSPGTPGADGYSPTASVSKVGDTATITITDQNGTTTASVSDGTDGTDGITPSITASATVDNTTGTPSVSVTKSGTDTNPNFAFAFEHLKGADGTSPTLDSLPSSSITHIGTLNDFKCNKFLGLVILNLSITLSTTTSWQDIFTLPSGWRPSIAVSPAVMVADKIAQNHEIQTNGVFHARFNSAGSTTLRVMAVYNTV